MSESPDFLGQLDPDDPKQASQQIANKLRAAILTRRLAPGDKLPSQPELATRYGVARETVKRALDLLRAERLIVSRQGSGVFVRAQTQRAVELRPHVEAAFERPHVTIDFAGFSGETLRDALAETLDKVRVGRLAPETIAVRVLISDMTAPMALPTRVETQTDDPAVRERAERITRRAVDAIIDQVTELGDLGLIRSAAVEVRLQRASPQFKLYILNNEEVFYGFYPVTERSVSIKGEPMAIYDLMGKDVPLFHYAVTDDDTSHGTQFVEASRQWFDSVWSTIAYRYDA
ncbi:MULTISPECIES: winged helix-turn-helix domain-containing protein [unclassified Micromonospora]|uniref:winged helix-turn-helix domain-containing protein n=1 Tax=unclassified Micromonospora TaxID=2617518 RepID=UPI0010334E63|nr:MULTISPECIES: winged helix-turn-helix domain-containing protein [unclassified Micromonospora]QKW11404.1 winged helix-turn-helix transcriptional regulator [Verrucosispora sp. NA02020]TBL42243.1 GntR family transcriptional regulator [Verrucosispora sp. SN26_14.1]